MDENKIITEALDSLIPDNQQKDDIWQRIEACTDVYDLDKTARTEVTAKKSSKKSRSGSMAARIIAVAAAFVLVFGSLAWLIRLCSRKQSNRHDSQRSARIHR